MAGQPEKPMAEEQGPPRIVVARSMQEAEAMIRQGSRGAVVEANQPPSAVQVPSSGEATEAQVIGGTIGSTEGDPRGRFIVAQVPREGPAFDQPPPEPSSTESRLNSQEQGWLGQYRQLDAASEGAGGPPQPPEIPRTAEQLRLPEDRETLPPIEDLIFEIRRLEALRANQRYERGRSFNPEEQYPILQALELRYSQIEEYAREMESTKLVELRQRLTSYSRLEAGLPSNRTDLQQLLTFADSLQGVDPEIANLRASIKIFEDGEKDGTLSQADKDNLRQTRAMLSVRENAQGAISQLEGRITDLEGQLQNQPSRVEAEQRIQALEQKAQTPQRLTADEEAELTRLRETNSLHTELEESRQRVQIYRRYNPDPSTNNPNIVIARINELRRDIIRGRSPAEVEDRARTLARRSQIPGDLTNTEQAELNGIRELRNLLVTALRDKRIGAADQEDLIVRIGVEQLIYKYMPRPTEGGQGLADWEREQRQADEVKEAAAQRDIERFEDLPPFSQLIEARDRAKAANDQPALELAEFRIGRYFYHARQDGITSDIYDDFNTLLRSLRNPEVSYYGEVRSLTTSQIRSAALAYRDDIGEYAIEGWDYTKYGGGIGGPTGAGVGGVRTWAARYAQVHLRRALERVTNPTAEDLPYLFGEWNLDREDRKIREEALRRDLYERNYAGYYTIRINPESPYAEQQLELVANQWIDFMGSGVIPKNPQEQLAEWRKFIEQWVSVAQKVYDKVYTLRFPEERHRDLAKRLSRERVAKHRQQYKFRVEAPVTAYFNDVDDAEKFAAMHQNMNEDLEGPEVWREGYGALDGMVARACYEIENNPTVSRIFFHPEGSRGYLSGKPVAQRLLREGVIEQLREQLAGMTITDRPPIQLEEEQALNLRIDNLRVQLANIPANSRDRQTARSRRELAMLIEQRKIRSWANRSVNLEEIGRDQPAKDFEALYGKLEEQADFQRLDPKEQELVKRENRQKAEQAIKFALVILDMTGLHSQRGGPTIKIRHPDLLMKDYLIQSLKQDIADLNEFVKKNRYVAVNLDAKDNIVPQGAFVKRLDVTKIPEANRNQNAWWKYLASEIQAIERKKDPNSKDDQGGKLVRLNEQLKDAHKQRNAMVKQLRGSDNAFDKRPDGDRLPLRMAVRFAQYAAFKTEEAWTKEADRIMKDPNIVDKDKEIQQLCVDLIPDKWNIKNQWETQGKKQELFDRLEALETVVKHNVSEGAIREAKEEIADLLELTWEQIKDKKIDEIGQIIASLPVGTAKLNMTDVIEGAYRQALDVAFTKGLQATLNVPVVTVDDRTGKRRIDTEPASNKKDTEGKLQYPHLPEDTLYIEDIERVPESNGMLMVYLASEWAPGQFMTEAYRAEMAQAGTGGLIGRDLRILDPAFNRFFRADDPDFLRGDYQQLKRALHAGVETQYQRHYQIIIEALERCVIGADIRKNKTGNPADRYKIIDGDPYTNLVEWGEETRYVTGRTINSGAYLLTNLDRRTRRGADMGIYSPMGKEDTITDAAAEDTREYMGLIDMQSAIAKARGTPVIDFIWSHNQQGLGWLWCFKQRIALESMPIGDKQHTSVLEKPYTNGDTNNENMDQWARAYLKSKNSLSLVGGANIKEMQIIDTTGDVEMERGITTYENTGAREKLTTETTYWYQSYLRFAQGALWKIGVDSFLPDGTLNFQRVELGESNTLLGSDNGTSRHTTGIWARRFNEWRKDPRKGFKWYPGSVGVVKFMNTPRWVFGSWQKPIDVYYGRVSR